jgi:hypothetical protein
MSENTHLKFRGREKINIAYIFGIITIITISILVVGIIITRRAIDPEALVNFRLMRELTFTDVWAGETAPGHFVTYRPITASLLRLEYLLFGINPPAFFTINLILLVIVAVLIFEIIYRASHEMLPALVATLLFVTDWRLTPNIFVIGEVQITLAAIFGLGAFWLIWFGKGKFKPIFVLSLLLLSALSKEFGLAFALAVFVDAFLNKTTGRKYAGIALGAVAAYFILRLSLGVTLPVTGEPSAFNDLVVEYITNISGGFIFTFFNLFRPASDGDLPNRMNLLYSYAEAWQIIFLQILPIIIVSVYSFRKKETRTLTIPLLFIILGNSFLFFWRYAYRFHFLGNVSMYIIWGIGLNDLFQQWKNRLKLLNLLILVFMFAATIIFWRGLEQRAYLGELVSQNDSSICDDQGQYSERERLICIQKRSLCIPTDEYYLQENYNGFYTSADQETVRSVMEYYNIPQEYCTCLDPYPTCIQPSE